ncbi:bifunctional phosphopantothenoylcysteine decarboxylase/phosphopantothenate--cysteine ligase CoaBC [Hydrogenophilus thermoluteolus]|uniref:Coenzyme A biosynthesis bifunctional protein CoaBC n=1 Tax=Hydrogenophilus thermoluteolus TaxID=297 RepID=A0A2Z6DX94_HYDTE|nr:bifunctional phosphopantothenoylcysteine decarboxylase/phosphopantothenate--cysteine ligase CoaBC [Hydrogenophilus thermoluteolus]BBD77070.1 bifunctional phosphopantothenoylcysteine decarboxylase/phosphopantothenate synthase [Hydrogenophilus thermoluteolus]
MDNLTANEGRNRAKPPFVNGQRIVLAVTGGIAVYKIAEVVRRLVDRGATVDVVMSDAATRFVTPLTFQALSGRTVWTDLWDGRAEDAMAHIDLTRGAALMVVAPATADHLGRFAQGRADDLVSTLALARTCPLAVVPAMNQAMWHHPATQRNVAQLQADGVAIWGPAVGAQACGEVGAGRMIEPHEILARIEAALAPKWFQGKRVVLTAGPTYEPIDPVRVLTNLSSGKMGFALAEAFAMAGAEVTVIAGPTALPTPWGVTRVDVVTAQQMRSAAHEYAPSADLFVGVAAVADYRPETPQEHKIKKSASTLTLTLVKNPDILAEIAALPHGPLCVGFAAESRDLDHYAECKRREKGLSLVVGNLAQEALGQDETRVVLYDDFGRHPVPAGNKSEVAWAILAHLKRMISVRDEGATCETTPS